MSFEEFLGLSLVFKNVLGFGAGFEELGAVVGPAADAFEVGGAVFIVDDERRDFVAQALLEEEEASDASVAVIEGMNLLKANVEVEQIGKRVGLKLLVFADELTHLRGDIFRWDRLFAVPFVWLCPILTEATFVPPIRICAVHE